ncbi:hypothetical protein AB0J63_26515 [Streptosporangium canum]|uniref:hypothetical protein n=1 Tax=Streptosporangium canum TaxID=324952 RepID=UPI003439A8FD
MATLRSVSSTQSTGTGFTCPKPAGAVQGDVLIAFQTNSFGGSMPTPTGGGATWQLLGSRSDESGEWIGSKVWWKIAGASEPAQYGFVNSGVGLAIVAIAAISDTDGATPKIASLKNAQDNSITAPSVTATTTAGVTLRWAAAVLSSSGSWTPPSGHTEQVDRSVSGLGAASLASKSRPAAGITGTATFTWNGYLGDVPVFSHGFTVDVGGVGTPEEPPEVIPPSPDIHNRFVFCDAATDAFIADLDLDDVTYTRAIGEAGSFSAKIDIPNAEVADAVASIVPRWDVHDDPLEPDSLSTGPGRTICHVYRNGVIWGSYLIWSATVTGDEQGYISVRLQGATLESYLNHVEIREDIPAYEGIDQVEIARDLIGHMQSQTHANIGLTLQAGTSGVTRDREYLAGETATYGQRIKELADVDGGFEWMIHTSDPGTGTRLREWRYGYPTLGSATTDHVFTLPGNIISWSQNIDALRGATSYRARGESISDDISTRSVPLMSDPQDATTHLAAGWLRLDSTKDYSTVKEVSTLNAYATRWAAERPGAVRVHQVTVSLANTDFTPANLGDKARLIIVNDWWPIRDGAASFDRRWRIIGVSVNATSRDSQETVTLIVEEETEI